MAKKTPDELAAIIREAAGKQRKNCMRATSATAFTLTQDRHYATVERQIDRMEKAVDELTALAASDAKYRKLVALVKRYVNAPNDSHTKFELGMDLRALAAQE